MAANACTVRSAPNDGSSRVSDGSRSTLTTLAVDAGAERTQVAQQRGQRVQVRRERVALAGAGALALADDVGGGLEPGARIARIGDRRQHALGRLAHGFHARLRRSRAPRPGCRATRPPRRAPRPRQSACACISHSATSAGAAAQSAPTGQRERTVASSRCGCAVTRISTDPGGGSSSVFSSAFCASSPRPSASLKMITRRRRLERLERRLADLLAHHVDLDRAGLAGFDDRDIGMQAAVDAAAHRALAARVERQPIGRRHRRRAVERLRQRQRPPRACRRRRGPRRSGWAAACRQPSRATAA